MSVLDEVLKEEYDRLARMKTAMSLEHDALPKGSISKKRIRGCDCYYLQYREGDKIISKYIKKAELDDIIDFHVRFERIHPFQDGNGRVGRLLLFWQCLQNGIVPFIITENLRLYYYRGIQNWGYTNGYLTDTCSPTQLFRDRAFKEMFNLK